MDQRSEAKFKAQYNELTGYLRQVSYLQDREFTSVAMPIQGKEKLFNELTFQIAIICIEALMFIDGEAAILLNLRAIEFGDRIYDWAQKQITYFELLDKFRKNMYAEII